MGRIDPKLIQEGEESSAKIVKYRGITSAVAALGGHHHNFVVYDDDSVEIFEIVHKDINGRDQKHTHVYEGVYPYGYILEENVDGIPHKHRIVSVKHPIELRKTVYGKKSFNDKVDKDFSEFFSSGESKPSLDQFFKDYESLFYDIPKSGTNSHLYLIKQSRGYTGNYIDNRDVEILELTGKISELEEKLAEQETADKEHPVFTNGTFLKEADKPTVWYMDKGVKRGIADWDTYLVLKRVNGHETDTPDEEVWILVNEDVIKGLDTGAKFRSEDLYGDAEQRDKEEEKKKIELDPDDFKADPSNYETPSDYIAALDRETRQLLAKEEYVQELYYRYKYDSENVTNPGERSEASRKFKQVRKELYNLRRKILK